MRSRQSYMLICALLFIFLFFTLIRPRLNLQALKPDLQQSINRPTAPVKSSPETTKNSQPIPGKNSPHPVWQLIQDNEKDWENKLARQSQSLPEAVTEYRRRYGIHPPPNFDKWYEFAKARNVRFIDEYDNIQQSLAPFWGLNPATIRARAREAIGFDANNLIGALIRNGEMRKIAGGSEWQMEATKGMMDSFIEYLPDMDLAFNIHDEPRVLVPYEDLYRLMFIADNETKPVASATLEPINAWSPRPMDINDGSRFEDVRRTRFNIFAHQPTWTHSRMSCSPDSPARILEDTQMTDNVKDYAMGDLGFIYNQTAHSDICQSPSYSKKYGFFDRPNAFNVAHDLIPVFSQSKISSFNDILYPSPWYWVGKVPFDSSIDPTWAEKIDQVYWRGSTTGGFSRDGSWRRQHRQQMVQKINSNDRAKILVNKSEDSSEDWQTKEVPRSDFKELFDVHFTLVDQCDPADCDAQKEFFSIKGWAKQYTAWNYKYLIDVDGNAFSGRFYAFLKSRSLVYKLAIFREWHDEWLKPWFHYVPMSLKGDEWIEAVRWFAAEASGKKSAEKIALQGKEWADKILRNEDLEAWFFRLLLEYGRLVDDNREVIGFKPLHQKYEVT